MKLESLMLLFSLCVAMIISFLTFDIKSQELLITCAIIMVVIIILGIVLIIISKINPKLFEKITSIFFEEEKFDGDKYVENLRNKIIHYEGTNTNFFIKSNEKNKDVLELMLENMKEIRDYYIISKRQARRSFTLAASACIIGFIFVLTSILLTIFLELPLVVTIISAIAGALSEFIAGTALYVYKMSLQQLNNYYESLHNNERFLSLVNLVSKMDSKKQDEAYMNIINAELQNYRR